MINGADIYIRFLNGDKEAFVELNAWESYSKAQQQHLL